MRTHSTTHRLSEPHSAGGCAVLFNATPQLKSDVQMATGCGVIPHPAHQINDTQELLGGVDVSVYATPHVVNDPQVSSGCGVVFRPAHGPTENHNGHGGVGVST